MARTLTKAAGPAALAAAVALALPGAPAATSAPALATPVFAGLGTDVVGRLGQARPNGEADGRFTVTLRTGGERGRLRNVVLERVAGGGTAQRWDADPGTRAAILAVLLDGRRLNPTDRRLDAPLGPGAAVGLDLRANDSGVFAPGERFRIVAVLADGTEARAELRLPGGRARLSLEAGGRGADVVGRGNDPNPNGEGDAHAGGRLDVKGGWRVIRNVVMRRQTTGGRPAAQGWDADPRTPLGTLAVFVNGQQLGRGPYGSPLHHPVDPASGPVRLDLYGNDPEPGVYRPPNVFRVTVVFTDSRIAPETFTIVRP